MKRKDFRFFHRLRVRWAEVDMQSIVFNAHYLSYVDIAVAEYWRALALPYQEAMALLEGDLFVKKAVVEYHASARFDEQIDVALKCLRIGRSSLVFEAAVFKGEAVLVTAELLYVFAAVPQQSAKPVPQALRQLIEGFEAGAAAVTYQVGSWEVLGSDAARLREEVFVQEQGVPLALEYDAHDAVSLHCVGYNGIGQAVATGRLLPPEGASSKIGRMAVKRALRGSYVGQDLLQVLVQAAREAGTREIVLHAQCSAEGFYRRAGFMPQGEPFDEVSIAHIEMLKVL